MGKMMACVMGAALSLSMLGCDDGPVRKAINCNKICEEVDDCFDGELDSSECKDSCVDDVETDSAQECAECLRGDSCRECSVECAGVGIDMLFN
jgi:hypothetical protein